MTLRLGIEMVQFGERVDMCPFLGLFKLVLKRRGFTHETGNPFLPRFVFPSSFDLLRSNTSIVNT